MALVAALSLASVGPVLLAPRFDILDCAGFYRAAAGTTWWNPSTYVYRLHPTRASYGIFLYLLPIYFSDHPGVKFWWHSGVLLVAQTTLACFLVMRATRRRWLGVLAGVACLANPSFAENYYTMFKAEPWIAAGAMVLSFVQWRLLASDPRVRGVRRAGLVAAAIPSALAVYAIKETGIAFFGVHVAGMAVLAWTYGRSWRETLQRSWWLNLVNVAAMGGWVWSFVTVRGWYSPSGDEAYVLAPASLCSSLLRVLEYLKDTAAYLVPALIAWILAGRQWIRTRDGALRCSWGVTTYFLLFFCGMLAITVPWTVITPRYYLQAVTAGSIATVLSLDLSLRLGRKVLGRVLAAVTLALMLAHACFGIMVGQCSEGRVQHGYDDAWAKMFEYVARHAAPSATVHFVMDPGQAEVRQNIPLSLAQFWHRGDITCHFPATNETTLSPGILCIPYRISRLNYPRMPVSERTVEEFGRDVLPTLQAETITCFSNRLPIWYLTQEFKKPQYASVAGIPAFWRLKNSSYEFGWRILWLGRGIAVNTGTRTTWHKTLREALSNVADHAVIDIMPGTYEEQLCDMYRPLASGTRGLVLRGRGRVVLDVALSNMSSINECAFNLSGNTDMTISNIVFGARYCGNDDVRVYNANFNGSTNVLLQECVFHGEVRGTGNVFKNVIAVGGATGVVFRNCVVSTEDASGGNEVYHAATHDAAAPMFDHVCFVGSNVAGMVIGDAMFSKCATTAPVRDASPSLALIADGGNDICDRWRRNKSPSVPTAPPHNVIVNGSFERGMAEWLPWGATGSATNRARLVSCSGGSAVELSNPGGVQIGLRQLAAVQTGRIYRLSCSARSVATNASNIGFGARLACYVPGQPECATVWMTECTTWWPRSVVITNRVTCTATIYFHLGYGNFATTGQFRAVTMEDITMP